MTVEFAIIYFLVLWKAVNFKWVPPWNRCPRCGDELDDSWGVTCWTCFAIESDKHKRGRFKDEESYQKVLRWLSTSRGIQARE